MFVDPLVGGRERVTTQKLVAGLRRIVRGHWNAAMIETARGDRLEIQSLTIIEREDRPEACVA
jgi:hypothetical protein